MSITLQFNVKPGDTFRYRSTFTSRRDGKSTVNTVQSSERIVAVTPDTVHVVQDDDPERIAMVYDRLGYPTDVMQDGRSIKNEMADDMFDISNQLVFPPGPVNPGDTWEAQDGVVHIAYRLIGTGNMNGREVAEVHSTQSSYTGPIKHWVEIATGRLVRKEYLVGSVEGGTTTVIERL